MMAISGKFLSHISLAFCRFILYTPDITLQSCKVIPTKRRNTMWKRVLITLLAVVVLLFSSMPAAAAGDNQMIGINVMLNTGITDAILADLGTHGTVRDVVYEIEAVTMQARAGDLSTIQALPYVAAANPDAARNGGPVSSAAVTDFSAGISTWDLDAINVTNFNAGRTIGFDGTGIYVAVLDTGLVSNWAYYFPAERIATQYAVSFGGGGGEVGEVSTQPNKWGLDQNSHGTHVTSTILGYNMGTRIINGVAPKATVIPVKVLNQNGSGWSSVIARGIVYVTDLKLSGVLGTNPVVINMSLGGSGLDAMEKAAIDNAVANGVIIVASAGNEGLEGMGYPGAYEPVISVAASGWIGEWSATGAWWRTLDVPETGAANFYITDFSSRQLDGQDLDVAAPGSWIVGPYQKNGQISFYFLGGTSMASPHVAGIVALMLQKNPTLSAGDVEKNLEAAAIYLAPGCRNVNDGSGAIVQYCWGADATGAGLITADAALKFVPKAKTK
jgi:subtilisin family serine protease